jgi:hypothetical protein
MSEEQFSDWEKGVRRTNLGEFSRENKIIESVTSGTKISDPLSVVNAVSLLSKEAQKGGAGIAEVTAEFQKLKQAVGDVNDPLYQLAQAAQDMATRQMSFSKGITGGRFAGLQATWDAATATQANFVNTTAGREEWMGAESSKQAVREQLIGDLKQYNNTVYEFNKQREYNEKDHADSLFQMEKDYNSQTLYAQEDFQLQRLYAVEDFNRSMKRAAEDGAKAMFNPYQREATKATVSIDMALSNLSEQKYLKKQGLNAVDQMRQAGVSDDAIAFFDLLNPANALQAQQFAYDVQADPSRVKEINKGTKGAVAVSSQYQQDPSNRDTARNVEDFERSMNRSDKAFDVSLERAAKAYEKQLWRIENSYDKSVDRSKKALQDYGREVMGTVETIIGDTSARLFEALGENTTEYFNNLNYYITNNGINEDGSTTPPGMTGASVPHGATSAAAAEANAGIDPMGGHTPGPSGAWKDNGEWWGMNSRGERFRLPDSWKPFSELSAAEQHEARIHKWVNAAKNAGFTAFANGGIATRSIYGNVGEAGPEAVIPLNAGGGQFLGKIYGDITMAMVKQMRTAGFNSPSAYGSGSGSTQINRNTNFTGPITVQAQDPNEMARKLESKKRLTNLRLGANASV